MAKNNLFRKDQTKPGKIAKKQVKNKEIKKQNCKKNNLTYKYIWKNCKKNNRGRCCVNRAPVDEMIKLWTKCILILN